MANTLQFAVNMSCIFNGDFDDQFSKAVQNLKGLEKSIKSLQTTAGKMKEFTQMQEKISQTEAALSGQQAKLNESSARLKVLQEQTSGLTQKNTEAGESVARLREAISLNNDEYAKANARLQELAASGQKNTFEYQAAAEQVKRLSQAGRQNSKDYQAAVKRQKEYGQALKQNGKEIKSVESEQSRLSASAGKLEAQLQKDKASLQEMDTALKASGVDTSNLASEQSRLEQELGRVTSAQNKLSEARERLNEIQSKLTWGNMKTDVLSAMAVFQGFKAPVMTSASFEQSMANVRAVNNANDTDFAMLREQALTLGRTTQFTAMQAANTQENLARGGFNPNQIRDAMPAVLAMAAAEGLDLAQAGEIVVKTLGGMGYRDAAGNIDASQSVRVADVLANISASSGTNIPELGEAMKVAAPVLSQVNASIEQITAMLGSMANQGFTGEQAGTALASSVMRLAKSPKDTWEGLQELGVKIKTRDGKMRQIPDILKGIDEAFKKRNLGETDQVKYLAKIFGLNQGKAMMGLMNASVSGEVDRLEASNMTQAAGSAQRRADIRNNTLEGKLTALSSAWEGLNIKIGDMFTPIATKGVEYLTEMINGVNTLIEKFPVASQVAGHFVGILAGGFALKRLKNIASAILELPGAFRDVKKAMEGIPAAAEGISKATGRFSGLKRIASSAWGLIAAHPFVAVSTAAVAAGVLIYENWDKVKEIGRKGLDLWERFKNWWNSWTPKDKTVNISLEESDKMKAEMIKKYGSLDLSPSYMKQSPAPKPNTSSQIDMRPSYMKTYASGGILTRPHIGLVAEAGPEAIIPLKDKSRGREVLSQAANILGMSTSVTNSTSSQSVTSIASAIGAQPHAFGGIMTRPHIGLVAEAGPEAIIPLRDKSRGREVLAQAANMLGMSSVMDIVNSTSVIDMAGNIAQTAGNITGDTRISRTARTITNSISNSTDILDMAGNIASNTSTNSSTRDIISMAKTIFSNRSEGSYDRRFNTGDSSYSRTDSRTSNSSSILGQPQINITVNASNNNDSQGLAAMIAAKVQEAWQELQERQARLAYA